MLIVELDTHLNNFHLIVNFTGETGKTTVLLGESGAGKSTVLRHLAGLQHAQQGHISLNGRVYFDSKQHMIVPPQERPFGYVFQDYVLFPHLTVFENVAFGLHAQHLPRQIVRSRAGAALERVGMAGYEQRYPEQLSGGQQQRIAIARALALEPELLLLDEPLAALDVQTRREVRQELRSILAEIGITTVMVTHHYLEALLFGEHILVLDQGSVLQQGGQRDLLTYPRSSYIAELVGVNFFRGKIVRHETDMTCVVQIQNGKQPIELVAALKEHSQEEDKVPPVGKEAYVIVDPRSITLHHKIPESSARNVLQGKITQLLHLRARSTKQDDGHVRVSVLLAENAPQVSAEITETSADRMELREGQTIYATFKATEASVYT